MNVQSISQIKTNLLLKKRVTNSHNIDFKIMKSKSEWSHIPPLINSMNYMASVLNKAMEVQHSCPTIKDLVKCKICGAGTGAIVPLSKGNVSSSINGTK